MDEYDRGYRQGETTIRRGRPCRCHRRMSCHSGCVPPMAPNELFWQGFGDGCVDGKPPRV